MSETVGLKEVNPGVSKLVKPLGWLVNRAAVAYVNHTRAKVVGVSEVHGRLPGGIDFLVTNRDNHALAYAIGQPGVPGVDAAFYFNPDGSWHFERTAQETIIDEGARTHEFNSGKANSIASALQVMRGCHFIIERLAEPAHDLSIAPQ